MRVFSIIALFSLLTLSSLIPAHAQQSVQCGDIIESEFTEPVQRINYAIDLRPGDSLQVEARAFGSGLGLMLAVFNPIGEGIITSMTPDQRTLPELNPVADTGEVSATGTYTIQAYNDRMYLLSFSTEMNYQEGSNSIGSVGAFNLFIGCTLRDGTVIEPGAAAVTGETGEATTDNPVMVAPAFGFPGLAPVDFANAFRLPLSLGEAVVGQMPAGVDAVLGFEFDALGGTAVNLDFTRTAGNLNLGLVVLSQNNRVAYMAALVTSETMNTRFTLPDDGRYTVGIFRIDLVPLVTPEATSFELVLTPA